MSRWPKKGLAEALETGTWLYTETPPLTSPMYCSLTRMFMWGQVQAHFWVFLKETLPPLMLPLQGSDVGRQYFQDQQPGVCVCVWGGGMDPQTLAEMLIVNGQH